MPELRDRLFERCGVPTDCGWTDDQLFEHIDLGLRTNSPTSPQSNDAREKRNATVKDIAWALNCHSVDALVGLPDDILAGLLLEVAEGVARAGVAAAVRRAS